MYVVIKVKDILPNYLLILCKLYYPEIVSVYKNQLLCSMGKHLFYMLVINFKLNNSLLFELN